MDRLVRALVRHIGWAGPAQRGRWRADAIAIISGDRAVLLPGRLRADLADWDRRLGAAGFDVVDGPCADVDLATGELVVEEPPLELDPTAVGLFTDLAARSTTGDGRAGGQPGRYRVIAWFVPAGASGTAFPTAHEVAIAAAGPTRALPPTRSAFAMLAAAVRDGTLTIRPWDADSAPIAIATLTAVMAR